MSSEFLLEEVDPADERAFDGWFKVIEASDRDLWPGRPGWLPEEQRANALATAGLERRLLVSARPRGATAGDANAGDRVVGAGELELPQRDNRASSEIQVWVDPVARRRGIGTALLRHLEELARRHGRRTVLADQLEPGRLAGRSPGRRFAERHGYRCARVEPRRELSLPVPGPRLEVLWQEALGHAQDYEVVRWRDRCPDEHVGDRALFARRMSTDAPTGEVDWEEEEWDEGRVRAVEEHVRAMGRTVLATAARHRATGRLVAFTDVTVSPRRPENAWQWDTLVLAEHRGRRLGMLVKVANLRWLGEVSPLTQRVVTTNADTNRWMIAVNDALGFEVTGTVQIWSKDLEVTQSERAAQA